MNVAVTGATGAMGRTVIETAADRDDVEVAFGVDAEPGGERVADVRVYAPDELSNLLEDHRPNALIDFTVADAAIENVRSAAAAAVPAVVGTTGIDDEGEAALRKAAETVPVLKSGNFSRGIQALLRAVEAAATALPGYDVEVTETHHNRKLDAPSGTAKMLLDRLDEVRGEGERVYGREGEAPRETGDVGVHARRAGSIRGEHEVLLAGNDDVLTLTHRAESRRVFAEGAIDAAVWLAGQPPGYYGFEDALEGSA